MRELAKVYNPGEIAQKWIDIWFSSDIFAPDFNRGSEAFSIVLPPPNVTGNLHIGHALGFTLDDVVVRYKRMKGFVTLWVPGTDHAGIATQNVVEKELAKEGLSRYDLGREKFLEKIWEWKDRYRNNIVNQLRQMGFSCDWSRERFTMDEHCSRAVRTAFVSLYKKGLIYKGERIINWCPRCKTALSDIEVEYDETKDKLYYIKYPLKDGGYITIATVRPETMLGDTAVAVNPQDDRYRGLIGKIAILPLVGRELPIIADEAVESDFGTGALKVTPAHDPADFEIGIRHRLDSIRVIGLDGRIDCPDMDTYTGLDRFEARKLIVRHLEENGYIEKIEDYTHSVGQCERCGTIVEPLLSSQWFVSMKPLAQKALERDNEVRFIPERWRKVYHDWLLNIRDWCISRQIWWGHRIPVWYCGDCNETIVEMEDPTSCPKCGGNNLKQEEDVLDTWFSSALWPMSTLGWPDETEDFKKFYPTSLLITGYDIIYFWVARMIMMGLEFSDKMPFKDVYITGLVRDEKGRKMSKSLGNVIDPMEIVRDLGTDSLRFALTSLVTEGQDVNIGNEKLEGARNFANKIWNAGRFILMSISDPEVPSSLNELDIFSRWILTVMEETIEKATICYDKYDFNEITQLLYSFFWGDFCDWYIEVSKILLKTNPGHTSWVLLTVFRNYLKLLHPIMPFITEELWSYVKDEGDDILSLSNWPADTGFKDQDSVKKVNLIFDIIKAMRSLKQEMGIPFEKKIAGFVHSRMYNELLLSNVRVISTLARIEPIDILPELLPPRKGIISNIQPDFEVYLEVGGVINIDEEIERLKKKMEEIDLQICKIESRLSNRDFLLKAREEAKEKERNRRENLLKEKEKLLQRLALLSS
ncbi:MAG: valine--tRNA ligase [Dictyoglomi bacterium]|nr:valine--tRNA ligase [Dictyoglomota bacterium]HHV81096.1 valine--tRNA ligase [bacterium]HOK28968.1 valine--tRNA ligase [bacterium]HOL54680.1 valine--tRNA ligase [bacterium]HPO81371.1 valine--tRNA ligase [bacterium]